MLNIAVFILQYKISKNIFAEYRSEWRVERVGVRNLLNFII